MAGSAEVLLVIVWLSKREMAAKLLEGVANILIVFMAGFRLGKITAEKIGQSIDCNSAAGWKHTPTATMAIELIRRNDDEKYDAIDGSIFSQLIP